MLGFEGSVKLTTCAWLTLEGGFWGWQGDYPGSSNRHVANVGRTLEGFKGCRPWFNPGCGQTPPLIRVNGHRWRSLSGRAVHQQAIPPFSPSDSFAVVFHRLSGTPHPHHHYRHFAGSLTPHARDLPIRRALMYSDWEQRSASEAADSNSRKLALRQPLTQFTTGIVSGSVVSGHVEK